MSIGDWAGILGTVSGWGIAFCQWDDAKKKGSQMVAFLHRLKADDLPKAAMDQVNDMLAESIPKIKISHRLISKLATVVEQASADLSDKIPAPAGFLFPVLRPQRPFRDHQDQL